MHKLDSMISPRDQANWLQNFGFAPQGQSQIRAETNPRYLDRLRRFKERSDFQVMLALLADYVRACIPFPRDTAPELWSCNLFIGSTDAYSRINMGWQETLSVYMNVGEVGWTLNDYVEQGFDLAALFDSCGINQNQVDCWGEGRVTIQLDLEEASELLDNPEWCLLTRSSNHFLMGRINNWRRHHNFALAQEIDDFIRTEERKFDEYSEDITGFSSVQPSQYDEGQLQLHTAQIRRRSRALVREAIDRQRQQENGLLKCRVCGFDFKAFYGDIGDRFIEVHHLKPLAETNETSNSPDDVALVCANCHRMLHRRSPPYTVSELRYAIEKASAANPEP
jgi:5-methylcytosine-specific restriction endonuclease McrA